jgi:hypothetical protein
MDDRKILLTVLTRAKHGLIVIGPIEELTHYYKPITTDKIQISTIRSLEL